MKKILLAAAVAVISGGAANAQQRLALFEEFSGENCAPCAAYNPGLWTLLSANPTKVILIKYQSPIPTAGPIYNAYRTVTNARLQYYNVPFAPYGRLDGTQIGSGNIADLAQSDIDARAAVAAPFTLTAAHQWRANADSLGVTVNVSALAAYAPAGANLRLRAALIERLEYAVAPGTNGETEFHNVVREMYPDAAGTALAGSWTAGQSQTFTLRGRVPAYVNKDDRGETRVVVWIQNDADRTVAQTAVSAYTPTALDAAAKPAVPASLLCTAAAASVSPVIQLRNAGTSTLTSAVVRYKIDGGAWQSYNWTGSLARTATVALNLPTFSAAPGPHTITDSVTLPNGLRDHNPANDRASTAFNVFNTTSVPLPIASGFENGGATPAGWLLYDPNANASNWRVYSYGTAIGHSGSRYALLYDNYNYPAGETNYAILPANNTGGTRFLNFYLAHARYEDPDFSSNDSLEVVYSTNCGASWTSVWERHGATLATAPSRTAFYRPAAADWRGVSVSLSGVPAGALVALKATSDYGNALYVDDVELSATALAAQAPGSYPETTLAPNPSSTEAVLAFNLTRGQAVEVAVVDALGRTVATPTAGYLSAGAQRVTLNTTNLSPGLYNVVLRGAEGSLTKRLSVVR